MGDYLKLFSTDAERLTYEDGETYIEPYVSYVEGYNTVHYNKPPFFCKLTLSDDSVVELEGSGELTFVMVSDIYKTTLVSAEIGKLCTTIGGGSFTNCTSLQSITIPSSVTAIGGGAFYNCSNLISVTIEAVNPPNIIQGDRMFEGNAVGRKIYVPSTSVDAYKAASNWSYYAADIEPIPTV